MSDALNGERLGKQMAFLVEADRLKTIVRRTPLSDNSRQENSAEHSWHLVLAAMTLIEWAPPDVDLQRVLELVAVHDLVEIDAGDTFAYDAAAHHDKAEREQAAAERVFGLLPSDQSTRVHALWQEFEANVTVAAHYANALDRLQALLQNMAAGGGSWAAYGVTKRQVLQRMAPVETTLPGAWPFVLDVIDRFCAAGAILDDTDAT